MSETRLVLVIEDDRSMRRVLRAALATQSFKLLETESGQAGLSLAAQNVPEIVLLDLGLPDMDGIDVIHKLRSWSSVPIIVISARGKEGEKIAALDAGADDFLTKPFGIGELLARIRAVARREIKGAATDEAGRFVVRDLMVDYEARRVSVGDREVHLTPLEYRLLTVMTRNAGKVLTHDFLLREVWGPGSAGQTHYVRILMAALRKKIEETPTQPVYILTEMSVGYRLADE